MSMEVGRIFHYTRLLGIKVAGGPLTAPADGMPKFHFGTLWVEAGSRKGIKSGWHQVRVGSGPGGVYCK